MFGPSDRYYEPLDAWRLPCCELAEDDDTHDQQACLDGQAEDAAEARAEREREERMFDRDGWAA